MGPRQGLALCETATLATGPTAAPFGAAPVDILADTAATEEPDAEPEPIDGFPPSDAMPEPPPDPPADDADAPTDDVDAAPADDAL